MLSGEMNSMMGSLALYVTFTIIFPLADQLAQVEEDRKSERYWL